MTASLTDLNAALSMLTKQLNELNYPEDREIPEDSFSIAYQVYIKEHDRILTDIELVEKRRAKVLDELLEELR
jgi:hypothetical protein